MTEGQQGVVTEPAENLAEQLSDLLAQQVTCARQGNMARLERLGGDVEGVIARMTAGQTPCLGMTESRRAQLNRQYDELVLTLRAEQADVQGKLKQLRQVKRVVGACNHKKRRP